MVTELQYYQTIERDKTRYSGNESGYRLVLIPNVNLTETGSDTDAIEFDVVDSIDVTSTSDLTTYPLVNGDVVADHMIRQPISLTVSGKFALLGSRTTNFSGSSNDRLHNIQDYFENLKNSGTLCKLVVRSRVDGVERFKERNCVVLTSIRWGELQSSLIFTFTFNEIMLINVEDFDSSNEELWNVDPNVPAITDGVSRSFTDEVISKADVMVAVLQTAISYGIMTPEFAEKYINDSKLIDELDSSQLNGVTRNQYMTTALFGTAAGIYGAAGIAAGLILGGPVGWVVGIFGLIIAGIGIGVAYAASQDYKYAREQFSLSLDDYKNSQLVDEFDAFTSEVFQEIDILNEFNQFFRFTSNEAQECLLTISNDYYVFVISKNNVTENWELIIEDIEGNDVGGGRVVMKSKALSGLDEVSESSHIFRSKGEGAFIYLYIDKIAGIRDNTALTENERNTQIEAAYKDITNYGIIVSAADGTKSSLLNVGDKIVELVENAFKR